MVDILVKFDRRAAITRRGDYDASTTGEKALDNLDSDRSFADTGEKGVLVLEGCSRSRDLGEHVEVYACEIARVLPVRSDFALEMEEGNLVLWNSRWADGDLGAKELRRCATATRGAGARCWSFWTSLMEGANDAIVEVLDPRALLVADLRLRLNKLPQVGEIGGELVDVDRCRCRAWSGHLLHVLLHLAAVVTRHLAVDNISLWRDLNSRTRWEVD